MAICKALAMRNMPTVWGGNQRYAPVHVSVADAARSNDKSKIVRTRPVNIPAERRSKLGLFPRSGEY